MPRPDLAIAVVEDDPTTADRLEACLIELGHRVSRFSEGENFLRDFGKSAPDLLVTDLKLPGMDGMEILKRVKAGRPEVEVVVITGHGSIETAIQAIKAGAFHFLTKPFRLEEFRSLVGQVTEKIRLRQETEELRAVLRQKAGMEGIIGASPQMAQVFRLVEKVAPLDCSVIIEGESGTGKELVARAIHRLSPRAQGPLVSFNCGGFSDGLIANELFGHEKGAFTGAFRAKRGLLEAADQGTLLLDEVTEMSPDMQVKLLRVLQEGQLYRVGGTRPIRLDLRVLAASNRDTRDLVRQGRFREDLYFRLNVVTIPLPRLKDREGDLHLLLEHFLQEYCQAYQKGPLTFSRAARAVLEAHDFPGNVRELGNIVAQAVALSDGPEVRPEDLPPYLRQEASATTAELRSLEDME
ncbi:MAG: sigma-54 dependent transcriptional regulator, partial [Desulfarculus sp.]|nr:sigma-54 dependent transcriptional regulator [Desulfarculus sp.]